MKRNFTLYIKTIIGLLLCLGLAAFVIFPTFKSVNKLKNSVHESNVELEKTKQTQENFSSIKTEFEKVQESSKSLEGAFVTKDTPTILETIEYIENLASARHVTQTLTINPIPESNDATTISSAIEITLEGSFDSIYLFIKDVEDLPYYININSVNVAKQLNESYTATLLGDIFWL